MRNKILSSFTSNNKNIGMSFDRAISIITTHSHLQESTNPNIDTAVGTIVMKMVESMDLSESLDPELDQISTKWAGMVKKYVDKGDTKGLITKIKGAIDQLSKTNHITKEEVGPFMKSLVDKAQIPDDAKKELLTIGAKPVDTSVPKSIPGALKKIQTMAATVKTPEEAASKAQEGLNKAGLKGKLLDYENKIYKWIGKIPLVGKWFSKQNKTKQRIIALIAIAVISTLVVMGVNWATKILESPPKATSDQSTNSIGGGGSLDLKQSAINNFASEHGGAKAIGLANGATRVIGNDGEEIILVSSKTGDSVDIINKTIEPDRFAKMTNGVKTMKDIMSAN